MKSRAVLTSFQPALLNGMTMPTTIMPVSRMKYAVRVGGAHNHIFSLANCILVKDNHIKIAGSITNAIETLRATAQHTFKIEVECETLEMVEEALACGVEIIMFDNMDLDEMKAGLKLVNGRAMTEASGGINEQTIVPIAETGVDIISVGDHFGRVSNMGARYTSVDTRDGREYLIPNEDFITQRVANWSFSSDLVRLSVKFNTTYDSDPRKAQAAAVEAALRVERVLPKPTPQCMLTLFGSTSIEYEMWFWISDPAAGIVNVQSDVLLALWDTLAHQGVKIPQPGPARVIYELAREDEPDPPKDQDDTPPSKSPFPG